MLDIGRDLWFPMKRLLRPVVGRHKQLLLNHMKHQCQLHLRHQNWTMSHPTTSLTLRSLGLENYKNIRHVPFTSHVPILTFVPNQCGLLSVAFFNCKFRAQTMQTIQSVGNCHDIISNIYILTTDLLQR